MIQTDISDIAYNEDDEVIDFGPSVEIFDDNKAEESHNSSILKEKLKETLNQNLGESRRYSEKVHSVTVEEENSKGQLVARTFSDTAR